MENLLALASFWVRVDFCAKASISLLVALVSPCNSADLPATREFCSQLRVLPAFTEVLHASICLVSRFGAERGCTVLHRFWDGVLTTSAVAASDQEALSRAIADVGRSVRLDSFLERCHDILELCQTVLQFTRLETVEVGGTKAPTSMPAQSESHQAQVGSQEPG